MQITCRATTWLPSNHHDLRCSNHPAEEVVEVDLVMDLVDLVDHHSTMTT